MEVQDVKVALNGATHWAAQVPRIADGFRQLGHEVTPHWHDADLVYSQNDHTQVLIDKRMGRLRGKVILCCLDVPTHLLPHFNVNTLAVELRQADAVVTISQFGQWQVRTHCGLDSTVIWNPIMPVRRDPSLREASPRFMHVGRRHDQNKRFDLGIHALRVLGFAPEDVRLAGSEMGNVVEWAWPGMRYDAVLTNERLNVAYNSVDFVLCTSRIEGLCLPVLEAMAAGAVPIVCKDMSTRTEILPPDLFPEYEDVDPTPTSIARFIASLTNEDSGQRLQGLKDRLHTHYLDTWEERVSPAGVARRIMEAYEKIA